MSRLIRALRTQAFRIDDTETLRAREKSDAVIVEEPLEIRSGGQVVTTTMRTPGHDVELVHGFLHGEGHITSRTDVLAARYCAGTTPSGENTYNVIEAQLLSPITPQAARVSTMTSACGICGSASVETILNKRRYPITPVELDAEMVLRLPGLLSDAQKLFSRTGGLHAAGAFTAAGEPLVVREDVGRHNAADKVVGHLLMEDGLPAAGLVLALSSRASFELVQKAVMAGFSALVAVSAPTSLAVDLARESGLTLVGFNNGRRFNLYSGEVAHHR